MSAIKRAVEDGGNLKRIDINDDEKKKRGDVDEDGEAQKVQLQKTLLYEETNLGSDIWRTDMRYWVNEIQRVCLSDYEIAHIAFSVVDLGEMDFAEAFILLQDKHANSDDFARNLMDLGFTVMNANYSREDTYEVIKEFSRIMCPYDLPMSVMVKALRQIIRGNGKNRVDGAIDTDFETALSKQRDKGGAGDVVTGYWSKGGGGGQTAGSLPESAPSYEENIGSGSLFAALDAAGL